MTETTSNMKIVTYIFNQNSNTIQILRRKSKENHRNNFDLLFRVYDICKPLQNLYTLTFTLYIVNVTV